ncbi:hypothetical protein BH10CHL1_BH10CHL1_05710 [soil metagenome]
MIRPLFQKLLRAKTPVIFADAQRTEPVSRQFGLERGTPIDRYYIERFLAQNQALIQGRVLEVAASDYSKRYGRQVEAYEVLHATPGNANATIVGDLTDITTLPADRVDCFICTQTFNFIFDLQKAVSGAHHLLKPGGVLLATVAGISQISRYDMDRWGDYWRFTTASVQKLFAPVFSGGVEIVSVGNVLAATAFLQGLCVEDLPDAALLERADPDYQMLITLVARKAG